MNTQCAEWLRGEIRSRGWSEAELGLRSGLGRHAIMRICKGQGGSPRADHITSLARALQVTPTEVLCGMGLWPPA